MPPFLLDIIYLLILIFALPYSIYKTCTSARFRAGWAERFGGAPSLAPGPRIWFHCASVGEVLLARTLVVRTRSEWPGADIVFSTNTNTGRETALKNFPGSTVFYFPLDLSPVVRKVFRKIRPSAVVLVELELWPNFLAIARRRRVPVVVVNGRITERTVRRHRAFGPLARRMIANVDFFAAQNAEYARRFQAVGVPPERIAVAGTMKYDSVATEVPADVVAEYRRKLRLHPEDEVILGGCTHPGEDDLLIDFFKERRQQRPALRLILAPRHRERADAVEAQVRAAGLPVVRKTAIDAGTAPDAFESQPHVILLDTTGELARVYALATVVFVGGSMVPHGGQNMIEPAALGKPVLFGPHTWNFSETVDLLRGGGAAVQIDRPELLAPALDGLLENPARRTELGSRARQLVEQCKGATERNFQAVRTILTESLRTGADAQDNGKENR